MESMPPQRHRLPPQMPTSCIPDFDDVGLGIKGPWKVEVYITDVYSNTAADPTTTTTTTSTYGSPELSVDFTHRFLDDIFTGGDLISEITQGFLFNKEPLDATKYLEWAAGIKEIPDNAASRAVSLLKDQVCHECPRAKTVRVYVCICHRTWFNPILRDQDPSTGYVHLPLPRAEPAARTVSVKTFRLDEVVIKRKRSCSYTTMRRCVICMDKLKVGSKATQMPCSHVFHGDCILKWLHTRPVCPVCRFELPSS